MRKALSSLLALSAMLICLPATAQSVVSLTLSPDTAQGGQGTTATVTLSAPAPSAGTPVSVFSLSPQIPMSNVPGIITVPSGMTTTSFSIRALPVDTAVSTFIGATTGTGTTQYARLNLVNGPGWQYRIAVYRPSTSEWILREEDGSATVLQWGQSGDMPVPNHYEGSPIANVATFRPSTSEWFIRSVTGDPIHVQFGAIGDWPAPADYLGLSYAQIAVFRLTAQEVIVRRDPTHNDILPFPAAVPGTIPEVFDFYGTGRGQAAVYNPATNTYTIRTDAGQFNTVTVGVPGAVPFGADFAEQGHPQAGAYDPATQTGFIKDNTGNQQSQRFTYAQPGDIPVPGDFLGRGRFDFAVYRPSTGEWFIDAGGHGTTFIRVQWGGPGDIPFPHRYGRRFGLP